MSFLEMLDFLNSGLIEKDEEPVVFDHYCRERICGTCSLQINGRPHGPERLTTTCQLHIRSFKDSDTIVSNILVWHRLTLKEFYFFCFFG